MGCLRVTVIAPDRAGAHVTIASDRTAWLMRAGASQASIRSTQAEEAQDEKNNHDQADNVDYLVHYVPPFGSGPDFDRIDPIKPVFSKRATTWISFARVNDNERPRATGNHAQSVPPEAIP